MGDEEEYVVVKKHGIRVRHKKSNITKPGYVSLP